MFDILLLLSSGAGWRSEGRVTAVALANTEEANPDVAVLTVQDKP